MKAEPEFEQLLREFRQQYPEYDDTHQLDDMRRSEFARLDRQGHIYLDYTGGGLYAECQIRRHTDMLLEAVLGNPHSSNPTSVATNELVESCRRRVMSFFNAKPDEYTVIFTANASQALKLVGESYPFQPGDQFLLTYDNHNSVNGIREYDRAHGANTTYIPVIPPEMRVDPEAVSSFLDLSNPGGHNLFAYPAQSNFSGVQHPLEWIELAHDKGWDVLLDAAAFVPTNRLDLSKWHPDYTAISFYKIFGYPTGIGVLIARNCALSKLHRPWFAGGTITVASVQADKHYLATGNEAFEDGTLDYANLPAVELGIDFIDSVGIESINRRVRCLTGWLMASMLDLRHRNANALVRIYGPTCCEGRGGTITLNLHDSAGKLIDHEIVEERANKRMISLRTGCFCNPGAGELALGLSKDELVSCFSASDSPMTYDDFRGCVSTDGTGAVRVSTGLASTFADVYAFLQLCREFLE